MKTVKFLLMVLLCGLTGPVWSQTEARVYGLRFYEQLAAKDAAYEWDLQQLNREDELDYWSDQSNFERHLGKANFPAYLAYMKGKKEAYKSHLNKCNADCSYSVLYLSKAKEYLSLTDAEFFSGYSMSNVVQNTSRKRK